MNSRLHKVLSLMMALALVAVQVGYSDSSPESSSSAKKDSIVVGEIADVTTLDPTQTSDIQSALYQAFDTLIFEDHDADATLIPGLAQKWEVSKDGTEITFYLRKDVKFHNGDPLRADDVVYTIETAMKSPYAVAVTDSFKRVEKINDYTVKVYLKFAYAPALRCFTASQLQIVNKKAREADPKGYGRAPIGTGAYKFVKWVPGSSIEFEAFPDYWRGKAPIKHWTLKIIPDVSTQVVALEKGEVDILDNNPSTSARQSFIENPKLKFDECNSMLVMIIAINNKNPILSNKKVREAMSYAIDRNAILIGGRDGIGATVEACMSLTMPEYPKDFKVNPYDPKKAKQLLAEAGYPNGVKLVMKCIDSTTYIRPSEVIQSQLNDAGFNVELQIMDRGRYLADITANADYDITYWAVSPKFADADQVVYSLFHSKNLNGRGNYLNVNNPQLDTLLDEGRVTSDQNKRKAIYGKICQIIRDEYYCFPVITYTRMAVYNKNLQGVHLNPLYKYFYFDVSWK